MTISATIRITIIGKKGTLQIVYGLLCAPDGCPVAIEVFDSLPRRRPGATPPIR
jgi:hypothetical protein